MVEIGKFIGKHKGKFVVGTLVTLGSVWLAVNEWQTRNQVVVTPDPNATPTLAANPGARRAESTPVPTTIPPSATAASVTMSQTEGWCRIRARSTGEIFYIRQGKPAPISGSICIRRENGVNYWVSPDGEKFVTFD